MEIINISYNPIIASHLNELNFILFKEEYFNYLENSILYKNKMIDYIAQNISNLPSSKTPAELKYYGSNYIFYKLNRLTTWYIFFETKNNNYLITNIINSHCDESKWLFTKPQEQL